MDLNTDFSYMTDEEFRRTHFPDKRSKGTAFRKPKNRPLE